MFENAEESVKAMYSLDNASKAERNKVSIHASMETIRRHEADTGSPESQGKKKNNILKT